MKTLRFFLLCHLVLIVALSFARAEDWPQWMGATRDNHWSAKDIIDRFPEGGPKKLWSVEVASGYAGPAVVGDRVYLTDFVTREDVKISNFDRKAIEGSERVLCLDANNGQLIWQHEYPVTYAISYPAGPRCTPLVDGDFVYTLGAEGHLLCFDRNKGNTVWQRDLKSQYNTQSALWGYASHPLIDGEKLICVVGGEGSHTVAFHKRSGKELWRYGTASEQGYSPPVVIQAGGTRQLILCCPDYVAGVDPETGTPFWKADYGASNGSIIMTPVRSENYLFVGGYSNRNLLLELGANEPTAAPRFRDKPKVGISPVNVQPFVEGRILYGMDQSGELMSVDIPTGNRLWTTSQPLGDRPVGNGTAFIVKNAERFFLFCETGELVIARLTVEGYQEIDRAKVIEPTNNAFGRPVAWYPPAYANGRMYVRNDESCLCIELTKLR